LADSNARWKLIQKAGKIHKTIITNKVLKRPKILYYQKAGLDESECERIINLTVVNSVIPEPVRLAHIICSGIKNVKLRK
jgi:hypothetical protein